MAADEDLPPRLTDAPYPEADWAEMIPICDRVSARLLTLLENETVTNESLNPQMAGVTLLIAMGRFAGRYGYGHLDEREAWRVWTDDAMVPLFCRGFRFERGERRG